MPAISFFLATTGHCITPTHSLWEQPLPQSRLPENERQTGGNITYGRLFSEVHQFCASNGWQRLCRAASIKLGKEIGMQALGRVSVFLVKHGAFYHPARIGLSIDGQPLSFVINVAASEQGQKALSAEVKALQYLTAERPFEWFPSVYCSKTDGLPMFLADWFEGFHEFHLTQPQDATEPVIMVWDGAANRNFLSSDQAGAVYRDASMILTASYDPLTGRQIFPWHHASGDFVVRIENQKVTTRLITVRNYSSMIAGGLEPRDETELLELLLLFFIHLTVRMRLDRLDGVAKVVWVPDRYLPFIIEGFFQGLDLTARMVALPESLPDLFRHYFSHHQQSELLSLALQVATSTYDEGSEEAGVIKERLADHVHHAIRLVSN